MDDHLAKHALDAAHDAGRFWSDWNMWVLVMVAVATMYAKHLVKGERFDRRKFVGETILSVVGMIGCYAMGILHGMAPVEIVAYGTLMSLGGVRLLQWAIQGVQAIRSIK